MRSHLFSSASLVALFATALVTQAPAQQQPNQPAASPPAATSTAQQPGSQTQPGVRTVNPTGTVAVTFYTVQLTDMRASDLIDTDVYNLQNENVGEISDLIIDNGKNIKGVVLSVGGFLGIGDRQVVVSPASIVISMQNEGAMRAVVNTTKEELKKAPPFKWDRARPAANKRNGMGASPGSKPNEKR